MMTKDHHLKIIDFGTASFFDRSLLDVNLLVKIDKIKNAEKLDEDYLEEEQAEVKATFVGTAEYQKKIQNQ
jgi:3-phosphoinositide dependent protein kinase-1